MGRFVNRAGQRYGRLVAISYQYKHQWLCKCDCGAEAVVRSGHLHSGNTTSCGCRRRERKEELILKQQLTPEQQLALEQQLIVEEQQ